MAKSSNKETVKALTKMPTEKQLEEMRLQDTGYVNAKDDLVSFLENRRQAIFNIARYYHLDVEELIQEGFEVLLTCLRDYVPVFEKSDGSFVTVQFTTFFGNRMESRAMEMRNLNPEYQARQAFTEKMSDDERAAFRSDPPLLVQHLDHESPMQEMLAGEASFALDSGKEDIGMKIKRDSFFEQTLNDLIAKETDEKKKAALLHVKVGGVYNFQEIALHFGVTDSRASQVLNELVDAFYVQRVISGDLASVYRDFTRLKFNEKRAVRLLTQAMIHTEEKRLAEIQELFGSTYESLDAEYQKAFKLRQEELKKAQKAEVVQIERRKAVRLAKPISYDHLFDDAENKKFPLVGVEMRKIHELHFDEDLHFHRPEVEAEDIIFSEVFGGDDAKFPAVISEDGYVIDGMRRLKAAQAEGRGDYMCIVRQVEGDLNKKLLRIMVNLRTFKPNKVDLYYAIGALSDIGLSQQKIADCIGTSRTNVLVYAKVRDKAGPLLRALFEDGLIQVTNASTCADLDEATQEKLSKFLRKMGGAWSKGAKFNEVHKAAIGGTLDKFIEKVGVDSLDDEESTPKGSSGDSEVSSQAVDGVVSSRLVTSLEKRVEEYEIALKDSDTWAKRREGVITSQSEEIERYRAEAEALRRELEAAELMKFGSTKAVEDELKELKKAYAVIERVKGASYGLSQAVKDIRRVRLRRSHMLELQSLMEEMESQFNALRVEIISGEKS